MTEYRAYILNLDGRITEAVDFLSRDDEAAKAHARGLTGGQDVEIWQGKRRVELLKRVHE